MLWNSDLRVSLNYAEGEIINQFLYSGNKKKSETTYGQVRYTPPCLEGKQLQFYI